MVLSTKKKKLRKTAINLMQKHYLVTGVNLYFRNQISVAVKHEHIEDAVKSLEKDGTVTRVMVKGAVAYKLKDEMLV